MKIMVVYNSYRHRVHGEQVVVDTTNRLLLDAGHDVRLFSSSSEGLSQTRMKQLLAAAAGVYNPRSERRLFKKLCAFRPDVVHMHNLYPWISPSALVSASRTGTPSLFTVHHYGLTCPILTHFRSGNICTACLSTGEGSCIRNNCRGSLLESGAYALRAFAARKMRWFLDRVVIFIALSQFAKNQLVSAGFPESKIAVRPNMVRLAPATIVDRRGDYVAYVGRVTPEKGVDLLCEAAARSKLPLAIAGDATGWPELTRIYSSQVTFRGILRGPTLERFYRNARFLVVPSRWWEVCPIVALEAMNFGCPVLAANVGGLPEIVDEGRAGVLFQSGDSVDLAEKMGRLWEDNDLRVRVASAAKLRVETKYSERPYLEDLLAIYQRARALHG
jgi:glycosyltransferase involved in cell wall biosynthesis